MLPPPAWLKCLVPPALLKRERATVLNGESAAFLKQMPSNAFDSLVTDPPAGIAFMGEEWDGKGDLKSFRAAVDDVFKEALRVLKPGAHGLVWAFPRTAHWTMIALEEASFEIRDVITHHFSKGQTTSVKVWMAVDDELGVEHRIVGPGKRHNSRPFGKGAHDGDVVYGAYKGGVPPEKVPGAPEAERFVGQGTMLRKATEFWIKVRKPLDGTIGGNALRWGTGGINVEACGIPWVGPEDKAAAAKNPGREDLVTSAVYGRNRPQQSPPGDVRLPCNAIFSCCGFDPHHDDCPVGELEVQRPGSSRFFYVLKPGRPEKDAGCEHLPFHAPGEMTKRKEGSAGIANARAGAGRTSGAYNHHPTVKAITLMRYLCRLVTPKDGVVLDPFCGSGSTLVGALQEGLWGVGLEQREDFAAVARARVNHTLGVAAQGLGFPSEIEARATGTQVQQVAQSQTTVVHCKRDNYDVYIGRPSKWGNPFAIGKDGDRTVVLKKYEQWLISKPELLAALPELKGKVLGCWCAPASCHGHILARYADAHADDGDK